MYLFHTSEHHRHDDLEQHAFFTLLVEIVMLVVIFCIWPSA